MHFVNMFCSDAHKGIDSEFFGNRARYINAPPTGTGVQKRQKPNCIARGGLRF